MLKVMVQRGHYRTHPVHLHASHVCALAVVAIALHKGCQMKNYRITSEEAKLVKCINPLTLKVYAH